ncbi:MAG: hypothetical protein ACRCYP_00915 [Alphaproteobacteria bacterium]
MEGDKEFIEVSKSEYEAFREFKEMNLQKTQPTTTQLTPEEIAIAKAKEHDEMVAFQNSSAENVARNKELKSSYSKDIAISSLIEGVSNLTFSEQNKKIEEFAYKRFSAMEEYAPIFRRMEETGASGLLAFEKTKKTMEAELEREREASILAESQRSSLNSVQGWRKEAMERGIYLPMGSY